MACAVDGSLLDDARFSAVGQASLRITDLLASDSGVYVCSAGGHGHSSGATMQTKLTVLGERTRWLQARPSCCRRPRTSPTRSRRSPSLSAPLTVYPAGYRPAPAAVGVRERRLPARGVHRPCPHPSLSTPLVTGPPQLLSASENVAYPLAVFTVPVRTPHCLPRWLQARPSCCRRPRTSPTRSRRSPSLSAPLTVYPAGYRPAPAAVGVRERRLPARGVHRPCPHPLTVYPAGYRPAPAAVGVRERRLPARVHRPLRVPLRRLAASALDEERRAGGVGRPREGAHRRAAHPAGGDQRHRDLPVLDAQRRRRGARRHPPARHHLRSVAGNVK